jgi:hypothetical protein
MQTLIHILQRIREVALYLAATKWTESDCDRELLKHSYDYDKTGAAKEWLDRAILVAIREVVTTNPVKSNSSLDVLDFLYNFCQENNVADPLTQMSLEEAVEARLKIFWKYRETPFPGESLKVVNGHF